MAPDPQPAPGSRLQDVIKKLQEARTRPPKSNEPTWTGPVADSSPLGSGESAAESGELIMRPYNPAEIDLDRVGPLRPAPSRDEFESHLSQFLGAHPRPSTGVLFRAQGLSVSFGSVTACAGLDIELNDGEIVAVVGPNGAGKTSLCDALGGFLEHERRRGVRGGITRGPRLGTAPVASVSGRIYFGEREISGLRADERAAIGIARTFTHPTLFESMTVAENLMTARHSRMRGGFFACGLGLALSKHEERLARNHALETLELLGIESLAAVPVPALPAGLRRVVELGRALAGDPRLLILDEPAAGLRAKERRELSERIGMVCDELGVAVLVTDQDLPFVSSLADYVYVLEAGELVGKGEPGEVEQNPRVQATYLRAPAFDDLPDWPDEGPNAPGTDES